MLVSFAKSQYKTAGILDGFKNKTKKRLFTTMGGATENRMKL